MYVENFIFMGISGCIKPSDMPKGKLGLSVA